jgi:hypothetical protein
MPGQRMCHIGRVDRIRVSEPDGLGESSASDAGTRRRKKPIGSNRIDATTEMF